MADDYDPATGKVWPGPLGFSRVPEELDFIEGDDFSALGAYTWMSKSGVRYVEFWCPSIQSFVRSMAPAAIAVRDREGLWFWTRPLNVFWESLRETKANLPSLNEYLANLDRKDGMGDLERLARAVFTLRGGLEVSYFDPIYQRITHNPMKIAADAVREHPDVFKFGTNEKGELTIQRVQKEAD